jgi:transcriptional regulator with XRE-family HTH domain
MKFHMTREWLAQKIASGDDTEIAAGGTSIDELESKSARKIVSPAALADAPTSIAKVVRFTREKHGWTRAEMAQLANIDEEELEAIETNSSFDPEPRTVGQLADLCGFSPVLFARLAKHRKMADAASNETAFAFAANSGGAGAVSDDEYAVICAMIEILSQRQSPGEK